MKVVCERAGCGKKFEKIVPWKRFCSKECKFADWSIRKLNEKRKKDQKKDQQMLLASLVFCLIFSCRFALASTPEFFNRVVDAIYLAEGGARAKVPYGILSVKVASKEEARQVCYRTVRNNWSRYLKTDSTPTKDEYLIFLAKRYAPIGASNDPRGLNSAWLGNVLYFLNKGEKP